MKQRILFLLLVLCFLFLGGCASKTYQIEQSHLRQAIIDLYTEQLKDNLTRAYEGEPFVHVAYKQMTGTVSIETSAQGTHTSTNPPAEGITRALILLLGGKMTNMVQVQSFPVIDNDSVYKAYIKFARNESYFGCTSDEQDADLKASLMLWKRGEYYYYVKEGGKDAFLDLIIQTTVSAKTIELGKELVRKILEVKEVTNTEGYKAIPGKMQHFLLLSFDSSVKNIDGTIRVNIGNDVERVFEITPVEGKQLNEETTQLILFYSEKNESRGHNIEPRKLMEKLIGASVVLELRGLEVERIPVESLTPNLRVGQEQLEELRARPLVQ